ncbi:MAG: transglutaminase domain-containing protein [Chromatocurvus sp.]
MAMPWAHAPPILIATPMLILLSVLQACAGLPPAAFSQDVATGDLLDGTPFDVAEDARPPEPGLLQVDAAMRDFLDQRLPAAAGSQAKVRLILRGILDDGLRMEYDNLRTLSAPEAFAARAGNCMSFTNLFIALAREAGLRVRYQEVMLPPNWSDGDSTWLYNLHVNAAVDLPGNATQIVDFNLENYDSNFPRLLLSDSAGEARHHNNMGVYWMLRHEPRQSFLHFRRAIELAPRTGHFWTNLGTLYRRQGHIDRAEVAMREAVRRDGEAVAMSNLAKLYTRYDRSELAAFYEKEVRIFRRKNPYYLYHLAQEAYAAGNAALAKQHAADAIRKHDGDRRFHDLLAMAELELGNAAAARLSLRRALALSDAPQRDAYQHKLELLADH